MGAASSLPAHYGPPPSYSAYYGSLPMRPPQGHTQDRIGVWTCPICEKNEKREKLGRKGNFDNRTLSKSSRIPLINSSRVSNNSVGNGSQAKHNEEEKKGCKLRRSINAAKLNFKKTFNAASERLLARFEKHR